MDTYNPTPSWGDSNAWLGLANVGYQPQPYGGYIAQIGYTHYYPDQQKSGQDRIVLFIEWQPDNTSLGHRQILGLDAIPTGISIPLTVVRVHSKANGNVLGFAFTYSYPGMTALPGTTGPGSLRTWVDQPAQYNATWGTDTYQGFGEVSDYPNNTSGGSRVVGDYTDQVEFKELVYANYADDQGGTSTNMPANLNYWSAGDRVGGGQVNTSNSTWYQDLGVGGGDQFTIWDARCGYGPTAAPIAGIQVRRRNGWTVVRWRAVGPRGILGYQVYDARRRWGEAIAGKGRVYIVRTRDRLRPGLSIVVLWRDGAVTQVPVPRR